MSFFKKLKDRLFRSSDKIGDGLEALVSEGRRKLAGQSRWGRLSLRVMWVAHRRVVRWLRLL
jgi:hypothetical protein